MRVKVFVAGSTTRLEDQIVDFLNSEVEASDIVSLSHAIAAVEGGEIFSALLAYQKPARP